MKNVLVFITLCLISISCSKAKDDLKIETNGYCSEKKAMAIANEVLDNCIESNYIVNYIGVRKDTIAPKSYMGYNNLDMSKTFKSYFAKEQLRESTKQEARERITKAKKILDKYPAKHIGYEIDVSGVMYDDCFSKKFSICISLDLNMTEYIYSIHTKDWDYYRAYNTISKDSIHEYLNNRDMESAVMKKYQDTKDISIYFYD